MRFFIDLNDVLADFKGGACQYFKRPLQEIKHDQFYEEWGFTAADYWQGLDRVAPYFYREYVRLYPWHAELIQLLSARGGLTVVCGPPSTSCFVADKHNWVLRNIGNNIPIVHCNIYEWLAKPDTCLISASSSEVNCFRAEGGKAVLFPQPWNLISHLTSKRLEFVKECIGGEDQLCF